MGSGLVLLGGHSVVSPGSRVARPGIAGTIIIAVSPTVVTSASSFYVGTSRLEDLACVRVDMVHYCLHTTSLFDSDQISVTTDEEPSRPSRDLTWIAVVTL